MPMTNKCVGKEVTTEAGETIPATIYPSPLIKPNIPAVK